MKFSLVLAIYLISTVAVASPVTFRVLEFKSARVNGVSKVGVYPNADGGLVVALDPNHCGNPGPCTTMAIRKITVDPKVLSDRRPTDGSLVLEISPELNLEVDAGYNLENQVHYTAVLKNPAGDTRLPLYPNVQTTVH